MAEQIVGPGARSVPGPEREPRRAARAERARIARELAAPENRFRRDVVQDLAHVLFADLDVDRVHDHAGAQRAPEDDQRLDPVVGQHGDAIAVADVLGAEEVGEAPGQYLELPERDPRALIRALDEDLVRAPSGVLLEQGVDVDKRARPLRTHRGRYCAGARGHVKCATVEHVPQRT
jgi:hypothetical protein